MRKALLFGFATAGMALAGLLAPWSVAHSGPTLAYFGAVERGHVENSRDLKDSVPDECARRDSKFETLAGVPVFIKVTKDPRWLIGFDEIRAVIIYEAIPSPRLTGSHSAGVHVQLEISEEAQGRIDARRKEPCGSRVRVQSDGRDLDLVPVAMLGPAGVLPGGAFGSREEAERFYRSIGERVSYVQLSDEDRAYWQAFDTAVSNLRNLPENVEVRIMRDSEKKSHVVLPTVPAAAASGEMSDAELEQVAGGKSSTATYEAEVTVTTAVQTEEAVTTTTEAQDVETTSTAVAEVEVALVPCFVT